MNEGQRSQEVPKPSGARHVSAKTRSKHVISRVHPRTLGTPCPRAERRRRAGLLARGSTPVRTAFSGAFDPNGIGSDGSPLTTAGQAGDVTPVPFSFLLPGNLSLCR